MNKLIVFCSGMLLVGTAICQPIPSIVGSDKEVNPYQYSVVKRGEFKQAAVSLSLIHI
jgi:hypothetical protein